MSLLRILTASLLLAGLPAAGASAAAASSGPNPVELGVYKDWTAYSYDSGPKKICYMMSRPKKSEPKLDKRGQPHLMVTHRPAGKALNEVSIAAGYPFKKDSKVTATIDKSKFELFTKEDKAWSEREDLKLVEAFKKGEQLEVRGTPDKGNATTDTYSLSGFGAALGAINKACNVK
jgi:hypothetical protein